MTKSNVIYHVMRRLRIHLHSFLGFPNSLKLNFMRGFGCLPRKEGGIRFSIVDMPMGRFASFGEQVLDKVCDEGTANFSSLFVSTNRMVIMDATDYVVSFSVFYPLGRSTVAVHTRLCETNWETKIATKSTQSANCTFTNT